MSGFIPPPIQLVPGQPPTAQQIAAIQAHMQQDAQRLGLSMEQYVGKLKEAQEAHVRQLQQQQAAQEGGNGEAAGGSHQHQHQQGGHQHGPNCNHGPPPGAQPVQPGPPKPEALAVAAFLKKQDLKIRTCLFQEKRKDMFRVKRALRALQSDAYKKARSKNPLLPEVTDRNSAEAVFKLLPVSFLALRVEKIEEDEHEHDGHKHAKKKRIKGLWNVQVVPQQDAQEDMYYMWIYEGPQWVQQAYAIGALVVVMTLVMFPLWPLKLRQGAWYLSMAFFGLIVLFFVMAIFRLILFCITMFTHAPGLWLFPNLFEDVGFVDSFIPVWAWQEDKVSARKQKKLEREKKAAAKANGTHSKISSASTEVAASGNDTQTNGKTQKRILKASVEDGDDE